MYGQLVRVIWECKRFLNWLVSDQNCLPLDIKSINIRFYILFCMQVTHTRIRTEQCLFSLFSWTAQLLTYFVDLEIWKIRKGFIGVFSTTFFRKRLNPAHYCCNFAFFNRVQKKVPYLIQYILRTPMSMEAHWR